MKKSDIKKIEDIINQNNIIGKVLLKEFLWINTTESKFKIGDKVLFSDLGRRIYGVVVKDFVGKIKNWCYWYDRENPNKSFIRYEIEFKFNNEIFTSYQIEKYISKTRKETIQFIQKHIDSYSNISEKQLIYVSKDNNIIMYEDLQTEDMIVCNKVKIDNKSYKEKRYNCSYDIKPIIWYLSDFLDTFYSSKYANRILEDFRNTDLEDYEPYKIVNF